MNQTQNNAQTAVYDLLTKGVGETHDVLIQQKKAESQMKTVASYVIILLKIISH